MFNVDWVLNLLNNYSEISIVISIVISMFISIVGIIPSGFVTLAAALSNIDNLRYNLATLFGKIPSILLEALISYGIILQGTKSIEITFTLIAIYLVYRTIRKYKV